MSCYHCRIGQRHQCTCDAADDEISRLRADRDALRAKLTIALSLLRYAEAGSSIYASIPKRSNWKQLRAQLLNENA